MCNHLVGSGYVTDLLSDEVELSAYSYHVDEDWTKDWPTEPGYYWFYGWCFRQWGETRDRPPEWHFVKVRRTANSLALITDGHFLHKAEGGEGRWIPANMPKPPVQLKGGEHRE